MDFNLILSSINNNLHQAFLKHFSHFKNVEIIPKGFEFIEFDCVVSAANSFGLMDGGVDQCITDYFGTQMMHRVQHRIITQYYGEQPVGTSIIVRAHHGVVDKMHYVAHTPTMRIPMDINNTSNVYVAMKAMLIAVQEHNIAVNEGILRSPDIKIEQVVCPGLGTNAGRVPPDRAALQMATALYHFLNPPKNLNWYFASKRHEEILHGPNNNDYEKDMNDINKLFL